jgi:hypothetical protein
MLTRKKRGFLPPAQALPLARASGDREAGDAFEGTLRLYQSRRPFHE